MKHFKSSTHQQSTNSNEDVQADFEASDQELCNSEDLSPSEIRSRMHRLLRAPNGEELND